MSDNTYATLNNLDIVNSQDPNQYKEGLTTDILPRNSSGVVSDLTENLGSGTYRWNRLFTKILNIGDSNTLTIEDDAGSIVFKVSNTIVLKIQNLLESVDGAWVKTATVPLTSFAALLKAATASFISTFNVGSTRTDIAGLTCTITTTGRPVAVSLNNDTSTDSSVYSTPNSGTFQTAENQVWVVRGSTILCGLALRFFKSGADDVECYMPSGAFEIIDEPAAGTYTYKIQTNTNSGLTRSGVANVKLYVREL